MTDNRGMPANLGPSHDAQEDALQRLAVAFPEAITDGIVDLERLRQALGEHVETGRERYGLTWPGKAEAIKAAQRPSLGTLRPKAGEGINEDSTGNLIIEGDNLEVLKLMQKAYLGKIKMIYIDPPYNTGNDFVYEDNFADPLAGYLEQTGQTVDGKRLSTNTETAGRYHSNWLSMMHPRLTLARNLLREDGVIFVSISDAEEHNLRHVLDEVFGAENFVANYIWNSTKSVTNTALVSVGHTFNFLYAKNLQWFMDNRSALRLPESGEGFSNPDSDPRGPWKADPFQVGGVGPNQQYTITNPKTGETYVPGRGNSWKNEKKVFDQLMEDGRIVFGSSGEAGPQRKRFLSEATERGRVSKTWWDDVATGAEATKRLRELMGTKVFDYPKPVDLIQKMLYLGAPSTDHIVLDFFAGSGTTAQAVLEMNEEDGGSRKFILVQLPENVSESDPLIEEIQAVCEEIGVEVNIAEITKERVRRVIKKLDGSTTDGLGLDGKKELDRGFKVYALDRSNFVAWDATAATDAASLEQQLELAVDNVVHGRSHADLLAEILLKTGFPLDTPITTVTIAGTDVYQVADPGFLVCLADMVDAPLIKAIAATKPHRVVILDAAFQGNDALKTNAVQAFKDQGVEMFRTA